MSPPTSDQGSVTASPGEQPLTECASGSFVFQMAHALPASFCAALIAKFEAHADEQYPGRVGQQATADPSIKRSLDLVLSGKPHWEAQDRQLFASLQRALTRMQRRFPFFGGRFRDLGYAVQKTSPGEYYHWHIDSGSHAFSTRQLVAIWYLNDVPGPGGETEFRHQALKVKPETGKLILFPPFWTHEHRGVTLEAGVKYIATTWVLFG